MDKKMITRVLSDKPWMTAPEIFNELKARIETRDDKRLIKAAFPDEDQSIRVLLAKMRKDGFVRSRERAKTVLLEWSIV